MDTVVRYRYRAYPDANTHRALSRTFGSCRVVANDAIAARRQARALGRPYPSLAHLSRTLITDAKHTPERAWLGEVSAVALQQSLADADRAYRNYFASINGTRAGRKMGSPRFRSRHDSRQAARFTANARFTITRTGDRVAVLTLPKIGRVPFVLSRPLLSTPSSVTVIREADGRTYLSFLVRVTETPRKPTGRVCGVDVGLASFAHILTADESTGAEHTTQITSTRYLLRKARALARSQRSLSRKQKGSANRGKAKARVAVLHRKVRETRLDHAHQIAAQITADHDVIAVEDLAVTGMSRTSMAKSVHDTAMAQFLRILAEKATRQGRTLIKVGRWFPSTRLCSHCHQLTGPKGIPGLRVRHWTCTTCGTDHDRDINAARNILTEGLRLLAASSTDAPEQPLPVADGRSETINACGAEVRPSETVAPGDEPGRSRKVLQRC